MKKSLWVAGFGALLLISFSSAQAEERWPKWYVGLSGGYTYMKDEDVSGSGTSARSISLDNGFGAGGSIGYLPNFSSPFLNNLRFEGEVTYHRNSLDKVKTASSSVSADGKYDTIAYMANAFYDLPTGSAWSPYIGGGLGLASVHLSNNSTVANSETHDNKFAYQGLIGIGYSPETIPNTQWTLGYRYLATTDPKFSGASGDIKTEYSTHSLEAGAKFRF
jgi:opacity protein-like surface antigen